MKKLTAIAACCVLVITGYSQCTPLAATGTPGITPPADSLPCVERGIAYSAVSFFENFVSAGTFTVETVTIDSLVGLPDGITYTMDNGAQSRTYGPGETGCMGMSGITYAAVDTYFLEIYLTVKVVGLPALSGSFSYFSGLLGLPPFIYYLRVIEQGTPCHATAPAIVSGAILSEPGAGIRSVTVAGTGASSPTVVTGPSGNYSLAFNPGESVTVTPSKDNDTTISNGIRTLDILLIRKDLLAIDPLGSPYKKIAGDVNGMGGLSTLDILLIRSVILGNTTSFPNGRLWAFVPDDYVFPDPLDPFIFPGYRSYSNISSELTAQNFIGMKLGDVDNTWDPYTPKTGTVGEVTFAMDEYNTLPDDEITVPVKVKDFKNIAGYQFTISWDKNVLSLLEVNNKALNGYFGMSKASEGILTTSWDDEFARSITLNDDETVFELKFKAVGQNGTQTEIKIGSELTPSEAYNEDLDLLEINPMNGMLKVGGVTSVNTQHSTPNTTNFSVAPNPFTNSTNIRFTLPQDETVSIIIYDLLGKQVKQFKDNLKAGEHNIEWTASDEGGKPLCRGLYHIRMMTRDESISNKAVLIR